MVSGGKQKKMKTEQKIMKRKIVREKNGKLGAMKKEK